MHCSLPGYRTIVSTFWGDSLLRSLKTTPISGKTLSRSQKAQALVGALGEFRGILGAALGIQKLFLGIRSSTLGMTSHDLSYTKTTILGATPGAIPRTGGNPHERFSFAPAFLEHFFKSWGGPRASDLLHYTEKVRPVPCRVRTCPEIPGYLLVIHPGSLDGP